MIKDMKTGSKISSNQVSDPSDDEEKPKRSVSKKKRSSSLGRSKKKSKAKFNKEKEEQFSVYLDHPLAKGRKTDKDNDKPVEPRFGGNVPILRRPTREM